MGYVHKDWRKPRHRWAKMTNLQNAIDLPEDALNGEMSRFLSNWEWAEMKQLAADQGKPEPTDRTLGAFIALAGRCPEYFANGRWITPPLLKDPA